MQKPITEQRLRNIALFYLERFDASTTKLRQVLKRRVQHQKMQGIIIDNQASKWIENVIHEMIRLGYINDERYTENAVRRLSQQGKSTSFIRQKLLSEGLSSEIIEPFLHPESDLEQARIFIKKKRLGQNWEKDLAKLARAGFSYEIAKQALEETGVLYQIF